MAKVLVPLARGFEEIEAVTIVDVLRRGDVEVVTAALDGELLVPGAHGIPVRADAALAAVVNDTFDAIVLPGGGEGTANLGNSDMVLGRLRRQKEEGGLICAICAAPLVLVKAEVLEPNQQITCYPTCQMDLDRPWSDAPVVEDGQVITGQAPGSATLFALVVLKALAGEKAMEQVAHGMVTDALR